jgi:putative transposase
MLTADLEQLVFSTIEHKSIELDSPIQIINGMPDHIHVVVSITPRLAVADWVKHIKGSSTREVNAMFPQLSTRFSWQQGYGVLTLGAKVLPDICGYVKSQKEHHTHQTAKPYLERTDE